MAKINSRQKGAAGEREARDFLKENFGIAARRGQQFSGSKDSPDVVTELSGIHFEVKRVESLNLAGAYEQAKNDAGDTRVPVVMHRKNREEWMLTFRFADLPKIMKEFAPHVKA